MNKLTFRTDNCKGCGLCVDVCPKKVLALGTNTIVMPEMTPGMLSGKITLRNTAVPLEPKSCAASIRL